MKSIEAIEVLSSSIDDPCEGLPEDIFLFISQITPLVNVDLLIKDEQNRTLMTWREDRYYGVGWHLPGGIIRFKDTMVARVKAVAKYELGAKVAFEPTPLAVNEVIHPTRNTRGHFISLLFRCSLLTPPNEELCFRSRIPKPGEWYWHSTCPKDIIAVHRMYEQFIMTAG